jgi:hypothetical protein
LVSRSPPVKKGVVRGFVAGDARLPFVSCRDISIAAAVVFEAPKPWCRPPYPYRATFERALEETRRLVGDAWHLERYFEAMGFAERAL